MNRPTATYRIQFRNGMTFDRAGRLVPYLKRLGISHLYASPVFTATSASTHGYDITDANEIDPAIGGREGFDRMVRGLRAAGLGLILDIVPNHMAASLENSWWRDVVEHGENSRYARHFDIDWSRKLTLPFLGDSFEKVLESGEISVKPDPRTGKPSLAYYDSFYPVSPESYDGRTLEILQITDKNEIARLHNNQPYRLMSWRDAPRELSYRRFFEITGLAGVRVEDPRVFDNTHQLILDLVRTGAVDGLRIDHVDGLADPKAYLERLRKEAGPDCYIIVEKILGEGEHIPSDWPISGTTGYEFISSISDALVDADKLGDLRKSYEMITGSPTDLNAELRAAKLLMADNNFSGEVANLLRLAMRIQEAENLRPSEGSLKSALRELLVALPVYRTYGTTAGMPPEGRKMLQGVFADLRGSRYIPNEMALSLLENILLGHVSQQAAGLSGEFRIRFQQLTGPLMAKSVEDTMFFRHHMLLALNEVGAELSRTFAIHRFHEEMQTRLERQPDALSGTSTHDTKRGEDARARLYVLSEAPQLWAEAVARWRGMNNTAVASLKDGAAPEPAVEWMLYQALAGVWPVNLQIDDRKGLRSLEERFVAYTEKAIREAKLRTNWSEVSQAYEKAVTGYARHLLSPDNGAFLSDFAHTLRPFISAGLVNSLAQTIVKLTAPGIPDIYQGSEGLDLSLVDPDNRREPDFDSLQNRLAEQQKLLSMEMNDLQSGQLKQHIVATLLRVRHEAPMLFRKGRYLPLTAAGKRAENIFAFARVQADDALIVVALRHVFYALHSDAAKPWSEQWAETEIILPEELCNRSYRNIWNGSINKVDHQVYVSHVLSGGYFAVLRSV